ncbi:hypothetical protein FHS96_004256 [Sphingomonas zeicaulis]
MIILARRNVERGHDVTDMLIGIVGVGGRVRDGRHRRPFGIGL